MGELVTGTEITSQKLSEPKKAGTKVLAWMDGQYRIPSNICNIGGLRCKDGDCRICLVAQQHRVNMRSDLMAELQKSDARVAELMEEVERLKGVQFLTPELMDEAEKV
jgi:hypothetical protein